MQPAIQQDENTATKTKIEHFSGFPEWLFISLLLAACNLAIGGEPQVPGGNASGGLTEAEVRGQTGIEWQRVTKESVGNREIARVLSRPYPEPGGTGGAAAPKTLALISGQDAERSARDFVLQHSSLFLPADVTGALQPQDVATREVITNTHSGKYSQRGKDFTVVLHQLHSNIPVFEAECRVSVTQFGEIWSVRNRFFPLETPPTIPIKTAAESLEAARQVLGDAKAQPEADPKLYIFPPSRLVYRLNFLLPHFRELLIDAQTGDVVLSRKNVRDALVPGSGSAPHGK